MILILTVSSKEGDGSSHLTGTSSTTDTMDVILRVIWIVIVKHMSNVSDILMNWLARAKWYSNVPVSASGAA
jgi:hypothetical protein